MRGTLTAYSLVALSALGCTAAKGEKGDPGATGAPGPRGPAGEAGTLGPGWVNVRSAPYSAAGDGKTDDTAAFQQALNEIATQGGGIVWAPTGNYLISTHLTIGAHTTLQGIFHAPAAYAQNKGTTLLAVEGEGDPGGDAFITLAGPNSTLEGVVIYYPNQALTNPPTQYPWTVRAGGGDDVAILDTLIVNGWQAVDFGTNPSNRHMIRGLYGQPAKTGIWVDQCHDIGRIRNVHFWPFFTHDKSYNEFQHGNAVAFLFQRTDWEVVEDVFSWGYQTGAQFSASKSGAMNGQITDANFDNVDVGLDLYATKPWAIHVSNLNIANAGAGSNRIGIWAHSGQTGVNLSVRNASFWGSLEQAVRWESSGALSSSDARMDGWNGQNPAIDIVGGRAMVHDNFFQDAIGIAIHVGPNTGRVMITGNELAGNTLQLQGPSTLSANNHP